MSQENVALQRQVIDAINRRDFDLVLTWMDPEVYAVSMLRGMEGEYRGHGECGRVCPILRVMSRENVDLVRRIYDAWDRQQSARDFISDDVEYVNPSYAVEPGTRYGRAAFRAVRDTYEDFMVTVERFVDAGGDEVVALVHYAGTGRGSGVRVEGEQGYVWTVRDGLAVRFRWFQSHREALESAGLHSGA